MAGRYATTSAVRFNEKCRAMPSGCIEWTGGTTKNGYGLFHVDGAMRLAHRWAFEQEHGKQGPYIDVCHRCDNPRCVNLAHLFAGTRLENMADCVAKGRQKKGPTGPNPLKQGERSGTAKLTAVQVL